MERFTSEEERETLRAQRHRRSVEGLAMMATDPTATPELVQIATVEAEVDLPIWMKVSDDILGSTTAEYMSMMGERFPELPAIMEAHQLMLIRDVETMSSEDATKLRKGAVFMQDIANFGSQAYHAMIEKAWEINKYLHAKDGS